MSGPEFFQTGMGRQFYESTMPELVRAMNKLAIEMKRANDMKETEMRLAGKWPDAMPGSDHK